jgi:hypothetical protein
MVDENPIIRSRSEGLKFATNVSRKFKPRYSYLELVRNMNIHIL